MQNHLASGSHYVVSHYVVDTCKAANKCKAENECLNVHDWVEVEGRNKNGPLHLVSLKEYPDKKMEKNL